MRWAAVRSHLLLLCPAIIMVLLHRDYRNGTAQQPESKSIKSKIIKLGDKVLSGDERLCILLHNKTKDPLEGKIARGLLLYRKGPIVAIVDREGAGMTVKDLTGIDRDVPIVSTIDEALKYNPTVLVIGVATRKGVLESLYPDILHAARVGLSIISGLHFPLATDPQVNALLWPGRWVWDAREEPQDLNLMPIPSASTRNLTKCKRILTVGSDWSSGKMSTVFELQEAAIKANLNSLLIATGHTALIITGGIGLTLDGIKLNFAIRALEKLVIEACNKHDIVFVEGQGSMTTPSAGSLALLRAVQPTHMIFCHRAHSKHPWRFPQIPLPPLLKMIDLYEKLAEFGGSFYPSKIVGVSLNTAGISSDIEANAEMKRISTETTLPCVDVIRQKNATPSGASQLLKAIVDL